jgi:hypothetical protein
MTFFIVTAVKTSNRTTEAWLIFSAETNMTKQKYGKWDPQKKTHLLMGGNGGCRGLP